MNGSIGHDDELRACDMLEDALNALRGLEDEPRLRETVMATEILRCIQASAADTRLASDLGALFSVSTAAIDGLLHAVSEDDDPESQSAAQAALFTMIRDHHP